MRELNAIIDAYEQAKQVNQAVALATVVHVEGSSYRMPGARMLVQQNGQMTGAISGGCLEGDALRKALFALGQRSKMLVTYDTSDEDVTLGVQLGCNGIVHILFEPIDFDDPCNPIALIMACLGDTREDAVLITLFSLQRGVAQIGTVFFSKGTQSHLHLAEAEPLHTLLQENARHAIVRKQSAIGAVTINAYPYHVFYELIRPVVCLYIVGAGNDAIPLLSAARSLGWQVSVVDGRESHLTHERFGYADRMLLRQAAHALEDVTIDNRTAVVLMTHNYQYDKAVLATLIGSEVGYIGCLGPKKKLMRMLDELQVEGNSIQEEDFRKIHGPVGLNIGAEAPEEVALAIVAEILAHFRSAAAGFLRDQQGGVHKRYQHGALLPTECEAVVDKLDRIESTNFTCSIITRSDA